MGQMGLGAARAGLGTTSRARDLFMPLGAAAGTFAATVVLHRTGGHDLGPLATCWFHAGTGLYCPFCGSLRGVAALSDGDVSTALHDNAPVMLLLGVAALLWSRQVLLALRGKEHRGKRAGGKEMGRSRTNGHANVAFTVFFAVFAIYRNTPDGAWLAPVS